MKTYVSIGLGLHLWDVKLKDGKLNSAHVINGSWPLVRLNDSWTVNKDKILYPVKDEDFILIEVPKKYENDYNKAID